MKLAAVLSTLSRHALSLLLAMCLVGCSTMSEQPRAAAMPGEDTLKRQIAAVYQARGAGGELYILEIPSANNALSNALVMASAKLSSNSNAVKAIHTMLASPKVEDLAVVGHSPGINVAEVKAAVTSARSVAGPKRIYVFAEDQQPDAFETPRLEIEVFWVQSDGTSR